MNELYKAMMINNRLLQNILYILLDKNEEEFKTMYSGILEEFNIHVDSDTKEK